MEVGVDRHLLKKCSLVPQSFSLIARNSSTPRPKSCDSVLCQTSTSTVQVPQYPASLLLAILFQSVSWNRNSFRSDALSTYFPLWHMYCNESDDL